VEWLESHNKIDEEDRESLAQELVGTFHVNIALARGIVDSFFRPMTSPYYPSADNVSWEFQGDEIVRAVVNEQAFDSYQRSFWINLLYEKPPQTVTAEEYWQDYFTKHSDKAPKHIVFYDGDPSEAVAQFKRDNQIEEKDEETSSRLGFESNEVTDRMYDSRAWEGFQEIDSYAQEIIEETYKS
jgi:hypothetical protein